VQRCLIASILARDILSTRQRWTEFSFKKQEIDLSSSPLSESSTPPKTVSLHENGTQIGHHSTLRNIYSTPVF
jgi:hypothetical protein